MGIAARPGVYVSCPCVSTMEPAQTLGCAIVTPVLDGHVRRSPRRSTGGLPDRDRPASLRVVRTPDLRPLGLHREPSILPDGQLVAARDWLVAGLVQLGWADTPKPRRLRPYLYDDLCFDWRGRASAAGNKR